MFSQQTSRDTTDGAIRGKRTAKIAQQNTIRRIPESGAELGPAARHREAAPLPRVPAAKPRLRPVWLGCLSTLIMTYGPRVSGQRAVT